MEDVNKLMAARLRKLEGLREEGVEPYASGFRPDTTCAALLDTAAAQDPPGMEEIPEGARRWTIAGRVMARNKMGKATFLRIRDRSVGVDPDGPETFQIYLKRDVLGREKYLQLRNLDVGDFIGVRGPVFATRTGETTLMVESGEILTKSLRPLPEKFHGLTDVETRFRQRYVDLVMNPEVKHTFRVRSQVIASLRRYLEDRDFVEVETPMMQPIPGGATARPFETWHNALGMPLYLRIAPELYLKRLVVGGMERVYELNRNFRNEGLSPRHNPEFTMIEFYQAYATYDDLMELTEEMLHELALHLNGGDSTVRPFGEHAIDYARPFRRYTVRDALVEVGGLSRDAVNDRDALAAALDERGVEVDDDRSYGYLLMDAFEELVEEELVQPTFVTEFPTEVSPLARRNEADPAWVDRFELFVAGLEVANAFNELNDPIDQRQRFEAQVEARESGDEEAMYMDTDYVRALEYGMPPAAGEGIGVDRVVMLMADQHTIREVILFPHMRPESE
ncbi:MAG: lysine--tRNA ligase [Myxococcota bacterium]